jgi:hypothetical protein
MAYKLWKDEAYFPAAKELEVPAGTVIQVIKEHNREADGVGFTHGVVVARHNGTLYASWAANRGAENTQSEVVEGNVCQNGMWLPAETWLESGKEAVSHGAFLALDGILWGFFPHFTGLRENVRTRIYRRDDKTKTFREAGSMPEDPFWPLTEPQKMDNGNYVMAGCWVGGPWNSTFNPPAVAISEGPDMLKWRIIQIPKPEDMVMWGECTVIIRKNQLTLISRCSGKNPVALVSASGDYGETWSTLEQSNLPMCDSKPYTGVLSNGRAYLVATTCSDGGAGRYPLTIALTEPGGNEFTRVYAIRRHNPETDRPIGPDDVMALSYPYAIELDNKLYISYSRAIVKRGVSANDNNSIELAIVPLESLG